MATGARGGRAGLDDVGKTEALTRLGFAARGITYMLIGFLVLKAGRAEDPAGVLAYLGSGAGRLLLGLMALGFAGYALWRFSEAIVDSEGHGGDAKGLAVRAGGVVSALIHLALGAYAAWLALNGAEGETGDAAEQGAAATLALPGGWLLLDIAAILLALTGAYQIVKGVRGDFLRYLDPEASRRSWVKWIGRAGHAARGLVFLVIAWSLWRAGQETRADRAAGMDQALASLPDGLEPLVAAGLFLFGLFSLVEARYRRITDPAVLARMAKAAAR